MFKPLDKTCNTANFVCRDDTFTKYLKEEARGKISKNLVRLYVHTCKENNVLAYYALSGTTIKKNTIKHLNGLSMYEDEISNLPAILIDVLAKDSLELANNNNFISEIILSALKKAIEVSQIIGIVFLIIDADNDKLVKLYQAEGFERLRDSKRLIMRLP